ncbi:MAG: UTP--glucose-1-phosphate uridylyltransferase [Pirellulaceae bacterium]|nr:UTP--glucose-1-phosphate uridylyltransferase [Pirellulaceae bacterium]
MRSLIDLIVSPDPAVRDLSIESQVAKLTVTELLEQAQELDRFRRDRDSLYERVRALFFLYAIHRFHLPKLVPEAELGKIAFEGHQHFLQRRFNEAIDVFLSEQKRSGPSWAVSSALAAAYHRLAFQTLADQVRKSVKTVAGNRWMFRTGNPDELPLRLRDELLTKDATFGYPMLRERTSVRMDFSHSAWSDIFFLGMDFPQGARVINASINLAVQGRHQHPEPPLDCCLRVIDRPVLRLVSIDLNVVVEITQLSQVFDFAADYVGLLKAAVIASGLIPAGLEGHQADIASVLRPLVGAGLGLEIVSRVNDIPKGSRLAVSTNLLGGLIALCMRATNQVSALNGSLTEADRRIVAARAILGEWLGGSGGGWQDSGGVWPGIKLIEGSVAADGDPEFGVSRGRLLPQHHVFSSEEVAATTRQRLQDSLVLVHGGMAQNVGPILEMVTEKYLLRSGSEWQARGQAIEILDQIIQHLSTGDIRSIGAATDRNFSGPLQAIIPWCTNAYTERLIARCRETYGKDFWGFWMLGGMAGGGMGFIFNPERKVEARQWLWEVMQTTKREMEHALPFAMDPVVYDFEINDQGTQAQLMPGGSYPVGYYPLLVPGWLRQDIQSLSAETRAELERVGQLCRSSETDLASKLIARILPGKTDDSISRQSLTDLLQINGFDPVAHQQLREDLLAGRLGLAQNLLPSTTAIDDVQEGDVMDCRQPLPDSTVEIGKAAIERGEVAVVTLAAGVGSRWTQGAGVVKALHPFVRMTGRHRSFLDIHLAKSQQTGRLHGCRPVHIVTTGYMTEQPIRAAVERWQQQNGEGGVYVSSGKSVGLRMVPTIRDLRFAWEEMSQQVLDQQQQKVRQSLRSALMNWAQSAGEATDYVDNLPMQCLHPVGHWYEIPNLLRTGLLQELLHAQPRLKHLMLHNVDTLGASVEPGLLGTHIQSGACLSIEVITRRMEDRGGGLARVNGRVRLVEGLAMPNERDEFNLTYYNSMTTWIDIDRLLERFGLSRDSLSDSERVLKAVRQFARRLPTYITLKDVKKRWGNGQEDVFPVCQFEKLWGDMTSLADVSCQYMAVPTLRGQQLKDPAQLDGWLRDGSAAAIEKNCDFVA